MMDLPYLVEHWVTEALHDREGIDDSEVVYALSFQAMPDPTAASGGWVPFLFLYLQIPGKGDGIVYQMHALKAWGVTEDLVGATVENAYRAMLATRDAPSADADEAEPDPA